MQIIAITGCRDGQQVTKLVKYNKFGCVENTSYSDGWSEIGWTEGACNTFAYEVTAQGVDLDITTNTPLTTHLPATIKSMTITSLEGWTITIGGRSKILNPGLSYTWNQGTNVDMDITWIVLWEWDYGIIWEQSA